MGKMNSIGLILLLCMTTLNAMIGVVPQNASAFKGGDGSLGDPYQVADVYDLQNMSLEPAAHYVLVNDIDAQETQTWNWNGTVFLGFQPVGNNTSIFQGGFDGNGYEIRDLYINRSTEDNVGLFGSTGPGAVITNVTVSGLYITGAENVGGLVGANSGTINGCLVNGTVTGTLNVGGLVGSNYNGTISACTSRCTIYGVEAPGNDLVGHWNMDEPLWDGTQGEVVDSSGHGNNGTAYGGADTTADGKFGRAGEFEGNGDYIDCGNSSSLNHGTNSFTISGWFKARTSGSWQQLVAKGGYGWTSGYFIRINDQNKLNWHIMGDGLTQGVQPSEASYGSGTTVVTDICWHHFALIVDLSPGITTTLYLDWKLDGYASDAGSIGSTDNAYNLTLGAYSSGATHYFNGFLDDVRIYYCSLAPGEVSRNIGGLAGSNSGELTDCSAAGTVTGNTNVGGVIGYNYGIVPSNFTNCSNTGTVTGFTNVGGVIGYNYVMVPSNFTNCSNTGTVTGYTNVGGVVGYYYYYYVLLNDCSISITGCANAGTVSGRTNVGGVVGHTRYAKANLPPLTITGCANTGTVTGVTKIGGLLGFFEPSKQIQKAYITNCSNSGYITGTGNYVGGLVGLANFIFEYLSSSNFLYITDCYNMGQILGWGDYAGGLVGAVLNLRKTFISTCYNSGWVSGASYTGGLIGRTPTPYNAEITITDCYNSGWISCSRYVDLEDYYFGGLVGHGSYKLTIEYSYNTGRIFPVCNVAGGLVGYNEYNERSISNCFSTGFVGGNDNVGGLVGINHGSIFNCYSTGRVGGYGGGFVGLNGEFGAIEMCYSTGEVQVQLAGGFAGGDEDGYIISNCFWDIFTSGQTQAMRSGDHPGIAGKSTEEMMQQSTFTNWNFSVAGDGTVGTWIMAGYPHLQFEHTETIENVIDLQLMAVDLTADYSLAKSVGCSGISAWNNGSGFSPIGNATQPFTGTFDGSGYSITNPLVSRPTEDNVGLFGSTGPGAVITNVTVSGLYITGAENVGGLVGANSGTINSCLVNGTVTGALNAGGLVGSNYNGTISACTTLCTVPGVEAPGEGLVARWNMDEPLWDGTQGEVVDSSGHGNNGTAYGDANTTADGKFGRAGEFDGTGDYIDCGNSSSLNHGYNSFTITGWFKARTSGSWQQLIAKGGYGWTSGYFIRINDQNKLNWHIMGDHLAHHQPSEASYGSGTTVVTDNCWHHFALIVDLSLGITTTLYLDGKLDRYASDAGYIGSTDNAYNLTLGAYSSGAAHYFNGSLDDVRIYYRSLAPEEVRGLYEVRVLYEVTRNIGGLVGNNSGELTECSAAGPVTGNRSAGGLVGNNEDSGTITKCYTSGSVSGENATGGLAGANAGLINNCSSIGAITGINTTGGLVGYNNGTVGCCFSYGGINGNITAGGLVGHNDGGGTIRNSYSHCAVNGTDSVGGEIGRNDGTVANCYSAGLVIGSSNTGGLVGLNTSTVTNCFWDNESSGHVTSDGGYGRNTTEMKQQSTFTGWDFINIWGIDQGETYPFLRSWGDPNQVVPIIEITIEASADYVNIGDTVHYYVNITNHGPPIANNLVGTIALPPEVGYVADNQSAGPPLVAALIWFIGTPAVGQTVYCDIQVKVTSAGTGSINVSGSASIIGLVLNTTTETITINLPPLAFDDLYTTDEDTVLSIPAPGVLANDTDPDASGLMGVIDSDGTSSYGAAVAVNADGSFGYDPTVSLTLQALAVGEYLLDTFAYTIDDGEGGTDTGLVTVNVTGANDAPVAIDDSAATDEETVLSVSAPGVLANDVDPDTTDTLAVVSFDAASALGAAITLNADGNFEYNHTGIILFQALAVGESLSDSFNYTVGDGNGGVDNGTVTVTVDGLNDEPAITTSDLEEATENVSYVVGYEAADIDASDTLMWDLVTNATWLTINGTTGILSGTPAHAHIGSYWVNVSVSDGNGGTHTTSFSLEVYLDTDGDKTPDVYDTDDDGDGTLDVDDDFPLDPTEDTDTDGDGIGNNADHDDDDDGWTDSIENLAGTDPLNGTSVPVDTDGDGTPDPLDSDDDDDGWTDSIENLAGTDPLNGTSVPVDTDGDGTPDGLDDDDDDDGWSDEMEGVVGTNPLDDTSVPDDTDSDDIPDMFDDDDDDDGWKDAIEIMAGTDPLDGTSVPTDTDGDDIPDALDSDDDDDGWNDTLEIEAGTDPLDGTSIPVDTDSDGTADVFDDDDDGDGWNDLVEVDAGSDPLNNTSTPTDTDADGTPDVYDQDDDGDGWPDSVEELLGADPLDEASIPGDSDLDSIPDAWDIDDDGDGFNDSIEILVGTNPLDGSSRPTDTDGDGLPDEVDDDDDGDDWTDSVEELAGTDPQDDSDMPQDADDDGIPDILDDDDDDDGWSDSVETLSGTDPLSASSIPKDTDSDDVLDAVDDDDDGDGWPDGTEALAQSDPLDADSKPADTDGDGTPDFMDPDSWDIGKETEAETPVWAYIMIVVAVIGWLLVVLMILRKKKEPLPDEAAAAAEGEGEGISSISEEEAEGDFECPDCGGPLSETDTVCPKCGAEFEEGELSGDEAEGDVEEIQDEPEVSDEDDGWIEDVEEVEEEVEKEEHDGE